VTNEYVRQIKAAFRGMLDYPYKLGGWGGANNNPPYGIDCRGFVQRAFRLAGAWLAIGGYQGNVRRMVRWAEEHGRFRGPEVTPGPCWPIFYCEPDAPEPEPGNPRHIRHVALYLQPKSKRWPKGRAVSALNPVLDVAYHGLNLRGYAILGYCEPDLSLVEPVEPPMVDPEPPVKSTPADV